ncbi:interferon alpha-13-like [Xyrauchen texanus]|uniref:interferon alpha-13-like n=1 Tax=Xyrauchen texanus TaxID=154827 RepID=UPI002241EEA6|nr:interferon alpha-13-like [Xyrauchen texanus]XP_051987233.1 interferon alpha-13-like [Xyrauchen texanus]
MDHHLMAWLCTIVCFAQVWSLPTNCILNKHLMKTSYTLIETMGGLFPLQCLKDHVSIPFPQYVFQSNNTQQVTGVEKAIYQTLQNIGTLFENDGVPDQWNAQKLDDFLNIIYRQIEDSKCVMNKSEGTQDFTSRDDALKAYFDIISTVVKEKGFSYCAWEIMRKEILHTLKFILTQNSDIML